MTESKPARFNLADPEAESKMRSALGITETNDVTRNVWHPVQPRRHFVRDGEVQAERRVSAGGRNQRDEMEALLRREREARSHAEAKLIQANRRIAALEAKLQHTEMALREAQEGRGAAEEALALHGGQKEAEAAPEPPKAAAAVASKRHIGRPRKGQEKPRVPEVEQEPIWDDRWMRRA